MKLLEWLRSRRDMVFAHAELLVVLTAVFFANPDQRSVVIGLFPLVAGVALKLWSIGYHPVGKKLGDAGPFRFVRYPSVLSSLLILLGIAFAAKSFLIAVLALFFTAIEASLKVRWQVIEGHGREDVAFPRYQAIVPALIPNLIPYPQSSSERFNWRLILHDQHRAWVQTLFVQILVYIWFSLILLEPLWGQYSWVFGVALSLFVIWQLATNLQQWIKVRP